MSRIGPARALPWILAAWLLAGPALAQSEYTIGAGDGLDIRVWQRADLSGPATVDYDGTVTLPLIGQVRAAGQTPARLSDELTRRFSFVDRQVSQVTVTVTDYRSQRVYVLGQVRQPGTYSFPEMPTLWELIREAGGPLADAALTRVRIIPPEGEGLPQTVDLERALSTGDFSSMPELLPGATVLVPQLETLGAEGDVVYVYGSVRAPGAIPWDAAQHTLGAILAAGGPSQDADMAHVRVVRPGPVRARVFDVDLEAYTHEGVLFPNLELRPGDTVTVPKNQSLLVWRALGGAARTVGQVVGTIFFFIRLGEDDNRKTNTVVVTGTGAAATATEASSSAPSGAAEEAPETP